MIGKSNAITESKDFIFLDLLSEDDKEQQGKVRKTKKRKEENNDFASICQFF